MSAVPAELGVTCQRCDIVGLRLRQGPGAASEFLWVSNDIRGVRVNWQKHPRITAWLSLAGTSGRSPCHTGVTQSCLSRAICQTLSGVSVSLSRRGVQNWTRHLRNGLTCAQESGRVTLVMQPRMLVAFFAGRVCCWLLGACCHPEPQVLLAELFPVPELPACAGSWYPSPPGEGRTLPFLC